MKHLLKIAHWIVRRAESKADDLHEWLQDLEQDLHFKLHPPKPMDPAMHRLWSLYAAKILSQTSIGNICNHEYDKPINVALHSEPKE